MCYICCPRQRSLVGLAAIGGLVWACYSGGAAIGAPKGGTNKRGATTRAAVSEIDVGPTQTRVKNFPGSAPRGRLLGTPVGAEGPKGPLLA
jgi:hypothetical protein